MPGQGGGWPQGYECVYEYDYELDIDTDIECRYVNKIIGD